MNKHEYNDTISLAMRALHRKPEQKNEEDEDIRTVYGVDPVTGSRINLKYITLEKHEEPLRKQAVCVDGINCQLCRAKLLAGVV